jgi:PKD repeat protein
VPKNLLFLAVALACAGCAVDTRSSTVPSKIPTPGVVTRVELSGVPATGDAGGMATVTARVLDGVGTVLPDVAVAFTATAGDFSATPVMTSSEGLARTVLTAPAGTVTVTAHAGTVDAQTVLSIQPRISTPAPTPTPNPTPPPAPAPTPGPLSASISVASARFTGQPTIFRANVANASGTTTASWAFGDDATQQTTGVTVAHQYATATTYHVTLSVQDSAGRSASTATDVTITDPPPPVPGYIVTVVADPSSIEVNQSSTLRASVTPINGAPAVTTWAWDCKGTSAIDFTTPNAATCPYNTTGTFTARLTVTGGSVAETATTLVTVTPPPPPVVTVNCSTGVHLTSATSCSVSATLRGAAVNSTDITSVTWDFGDSTPLATSTNNQSPSHTYLAANTFKVIASNVTVNGTPTKGSGNTTTTILP